MAKLISFQEVKQDPPPPLEIKDIRNSKDAKRLLSRVISSFVRKELDSNDAKTVAYLLSVFIQIEQQSDLLQRIELLEKVKQ